MGPLTGLTILDLTTVLMGPYATQIIADMGANVIKVESPDGDIVRQIGPGRTPGMGGMFLNANRGKRSIAIDLKHPDGRDALLRLAENADAIVYNVRPQAMARLGLDYETLAKANPKIVYVGVFGYGQNGPYASKPAYDDLIQGASTIPTLMAMAGDGTPRYVPITMADRVVGLMAVNAILGGLMHQQRTGIGQRIDVPMFESMTDFVLIDHLGGLTYDPPLDHGGYARLLSRYRRPYKTSDGYICALIYNDKQWRSFFAAIGQPEFLEQPRFANHAARHAAYRRNLPRGRPHLPGPHHRGMARIAGARGYPGDADAYAGNHPGRSASGRGRVLQDRRASGRRPHPADAGALKLEREPARTGRPGADARRARQGYPARSRFLRR